MLLDVYRMVPVTLSSLFSLGGGVAVGSQINCACWWEREREREIVKPLTFYIGLLTNLFFLSVNIPVSQSCIIQSSQADSIVCAWNCSPWLLSFSKLYWNQFWCSLFNFACFAMLFPLVVYWNRSCLILYHFAGTFMCQSVKWLSISSLHLNLIKIWFLFS